MTPPAIEDLQPVQAKMSAAISSLYEAVAEAARLELSVDALRELVDLVEFTKKSQDELWKECERPKFKTDISSPADISPDLLSYISRRRIDSFIRPRASYIVDHGTPLVKRGDLIGFVNLPEHNECSYSLH